MYAAWLSAYHVMKIQKWQVFLLILELSELRAIDTLVDTVSFIDFQKASA